MFWSENKVRPVEKITYYIKKIMKQIPVSRKKCVQIIITKTVLTFAGTKLIVKKIDFSSLLLFIV